MYPTFDFALFPLGMSVVKVKESYFLERPDCVTIYTMENSNNTSNIKLQLII